MRPFVENFPLFGIWICVLGGLCCLVLPPRAARVLTLAAGAVQVGLAACVLARTMQTGQSFAYPMGHFPAPFGNELRAGPLEGVMALCVTAVMWLSLVGGGDDLARDVPKSKRSYYYIMVNLLLAAQLAVVYTNDLFTAYVFIDIITIGACSIVAAKPGGKTLVATMWYLVMSLVGTGLFLFGLSTLYGVTGHLLMPGLYGSVQALAATGRYTLPLFVVAGLICAGLGVKCALFPFHSWLPGAHAAATTASSAILSGLVVKCYIFLLIKIFVRVFGARVLAMLRVTDILLVLGVLGLLVGSLRAAGQRNVKGMLAYSSVAQVGYVFVGIGLGSAAGFAAACFHILAHAAGKAMLFVAAGGLIAASGGKKDWDSLRGAARRDKAAGAAFVCGALSMVGIPLFAGFVSKLYLASAALATPFVGPVLVAVLVVGTLLNAVYYLPAVLCVCASPGQGEPPPAVKKSPAGRAALWAFVAATLGLGLFSQPVMEVIRTGLAVFGA